MTPLFLAAAVLLGVSACGAGTPPVPARPATPLAAYIGNWATACNFHAIDRARISRTPGTAGAISIDYKTDYYANENCTGGILGTWTQSASATAVHEGTVDAKILFMQGSAAVPAKVDKVRTSLPELDWLLGGTGVVHTAANGLAQWCINYANGDVSCIADAGPYPAMVVDPAGLYSEGNVMVELRADVSGYVANKVFMKQ